MVLSRWSIDRVCAGRSGHARAGGTPAAREPDGQSHTRSIDHQTAHFGPPAHDPRERHARISSSGRLAIAMVSASWARCPPDSLPAFCFLVQAEPFDPCLRVRLVPARVQVRAELQVVGDAQPA